MWRCKLKSFVPKRIFFFLTLNFQCLFLAGALHASIKIIWRLDLTLSLLPAYKLKYGELGILKWES